MNSGDTYIRGSARDKIRGCMIGGAAGDALGYAVEFMGEREIFLKYGANGITSYDIHDGSGKAVISDDTQMSLFTATGLLTGDTRGALHGVRAEPAFYVAKAYGDWLNTQETTFAQFRSRVESGEAQAFSWLSEVPELFNRRAPGTTCLTALRSGRAGTTGDRINDSKGCGGIMRVAPVALDYHDADIKAVDKAGAEIAAITHGHSLGFMPAAVLTHIIRRIVFSPPEPLENIVSEAVGAVCEIFAGDKHLGELTRIIDLAVALSAGNEPDLANIHRLGEGWVGDEAL
ncbi:MAG: ADP-ribosylglycohydrolase family protein, partial [Clostridia bacterium]|nr:ADP-ribosylglycohydrolase family protein [Clostridia bacterium]